MMSVDVKMKSAGGFPVAVITLDRKMEITGSTVMNGGSTVADTLMIMQVPSDYSNRDPEKDIRKVLNILDLPITTVSFMTAAEVDYVTTKVETSYEGQDTTAVTTAGLSNQVVAGEELTDWDTRHKLSRVRSEALKHSGTINIIGVVSVPLSEAAKINAVMTITEAKAAALRDLGYRETGTTSDAVAIVSPIGERRETYAGTGFPLGLSLARSVRSSVRKALIKRGDFPEGMSEEDIDGLKRRYL